jgi:hypothetical protein
MIHSIGIIHSSVPDFTCYYSTAERNNQKSKRPFFASSREQTASVPQQFFAMTAILISY